MNMNHFDQSIYKLLGEKVYLKIKNTYIGIGGAGGLGSNCAFNLVRCGFSKFLIIDDDKLEFSNLNRQFYFYDQVGYSKVKMLKKNLLSINPAIHIEIENIKINEQNIFTLFKECHVIIEAFDLPVYKKLMVESFINANKLLITASGIAGYGNSDDIHIRKIRDNFFMVGDFQTETDKFHLPMSPKVNITAAKQADIVLQYIIHLKE